jgi:hypothetical protein
MSYAGFRSVAASLPPGMDQAVEQPAPQPEPGPSSNEMDPIGEATGVAG